MQQAEDVMGSLLKEYLTKEPDSNNDNKEETSTPDDKSLVVAEDSKMHRYDNVVAIVDPPRVGLHPTVSNDFFFHINLL